MKKPTIAILGAGSWGTAVAIHIARHGNRVLLWGHKPREVQQMIDDRRNTRYLPQVPFTDKIQPVIDLMTCVNQADHILIAVPSHAFAHLLQQLPSNISGLAWLTKGIDPQQLCFLSELVQAKYGTNYPMAIISGPSFAKEVAQGLPTALIIASQSPTYRETWQHLLHHHQFRTYLSDDMTGVQLCGAIKNVIAIACGMSDGLQYGANAKSALITRGLAEMTRLGLCFHAKPETFTGLAGVGDLVLTCTDNQSRNRRFGLLLGQGQAVDDAEKQIGQVVEGKYNAAQICTLAQRNHIDVPICEAVHAVLEGKKTAQEAADDLLQRPAKLNEA